MNEAYYMSNNRAGAAALFIGAIANFALMAVHPTHGAGPALIAHFGVNDLVHGTALATAPVLLYGIWALTMHVGARRPLALLAFSFYLFGAMAIMLAATVSGLVTPAAIEAALSAAGDERADFARLAHLAMWFNRAFANVHVALFSISLILYALAWPGRALTDYCVRLIGLAGGAAILAWQLSSAWSVNVHTMLVVVSVQGAWIIGAAFAMARAPTPPERA